MWKFYVCAGSEVVKPRNCGRRSALESLRSIENDHGASIQAIVHCGGVEVQWEWRALCTAGVEATTIVRNTNLIRFN